MQKYLVGLLSLGLLACGSGSSSSVYTPGKPPPDTQAQNTADFNTASDRDNDDDENRPRRNGDDGDDRRRVSFRDDPRLDSPRTLCAVRVGNVMTGPARMGGGVAVANPVLLPCTARSRTRR